MSRTHDAHTNDGGDRMSTDEPQRTRRRAALPAAVLVLVLVALGVVATRATWSDGVSFRGSGQVSTFFLQGVVQDELPGESDWRLARDMNEPLALPDVTLTPGETVRQRVWLRATTQAEPQRWAKVAVPEIVVPTGLPDLPDGLTVHAEIPDRSEEEPHGWAAGFQPGGGVISRTSDIIAIDVVYTLADSFEAGTDAFDGRVLLHATAIERPVF